ncbi:MAG: VWA domain-containing protein [Chloroflexota bacterium]|nr:MAG: VWA domain-containing protein [Chloroflexota bacterium]
MKKILLPLVLILMSLVLADAAAGQQVDPLPIPLPPVWDLDGLSIEYQWVDVEIDDQVATTRIDQLFVNDSDRMLEGVYLFPLPKGAAVDELTMWIDGMPIEAKILEADEARKIYDEIVRQLRDPALLEYVGTSAIQANVFPIPPWEERRIEIAYSQVLPAENGLIQFVYPQSTELYSNTALDNQRIRVEVLSDEAIRAIYSPSHPVAIDRDGDYQAVVGFEDSDVLADQDFELFYTIAPEDIGLNLLSYQEEGQDGFFLLLVAPAVDVDSDQVVAKDVILVVDTSGSMEGQKMEQAKEAAAFVVDNLNPRDRFNVIAFSTGIRNFEKGLVPADDAGDYRQFIERLEAVGGTNISGALLEAVAQVDKERPTTLIFLTDGLATEGITDTSLLLDTVKQQAADNVRLFAFGVGDDVDTALLDSLTQNHRGTTTYVRPGQDIDEAVSGFYAKVSTPVLANISLDFEDIVVEQMYPAELPDLFAGSQLVLAGRYREGGPATITLTGEVNGREQRFEYEDNVFRSSGGQDFIPRLWATRAIGHLLTQIRLYGEDPELVQSVIDLSIRYGIITPYTSYLIEEDDIFSQTGRDGIAEGAMEDIVEVTRVVTGERAVEAAAEEAEMAAADAPMAPEPMATVIADDGTVQMVEEVVQMVGSKTFVMRDGLWIDTVFEADSQTPEQVGFASDAYFELLSAAPELGQYLALGSRVLVVHDGVAYEVVEGQGSTTVTLPSNDQSGDTPIDSGGGDPETTEPPDAPEDIPGEVENENETTGGASGLCASAMIAPLGLIGLVFVIGRRRRGNWM